MIYAGEIKRPDKLYRYIRLVKCKVCQRIDGDTFIGISYIIIATIFTWHSLHLTLIRLSGSICNGESDFWQKDTPAQVRKHIVLDWDIHIHNHTFLSLLQPIIVLVNDVTHYRKLSPLLKKGTRLLLIPAMESAS